MDYMSMSGCQLAAEHEKLTRRYEEYKRMNARIELLEILAEAEEDVNTGRVAPMEDTFSNLHAILEERGNE